MEEINKYPQPMEEMLNLRRAELMCQLQDESYKDPWIAFIFKISQQRVYQITNNLRSKKLIKEGEK